MKSWKVDILCRSFLLATILLSFCSGRHKVAASSPFLPSPDPSLRSKRTIDLSFLVRNFLLQSAAINNQKSMALRSAAASRSTTNRPATTTTTPAPTPPPAPSTTPQPAPTPAMEQPSTMAPAAPPPQQQFQQYREGPPYNDQRQPPRNNTPKGPIFYFPPIFRYINEDNRDGGGQQMFQQMQMPPEMQDQQMQMPAKQQEQPRTLNLQPAAPMGPEFQQMQRQQPAQMQADVSFVDSKWRKLLPWFSGPSSSPQTTSQPFPPLPPSVAPSAPTEQQRSMPVPNTLRPSLVIRKNFFYQFPPSNFNGILNKIINNCNYLGFSQSICRYLY